MIRSELVLWFRFSDEYAKNNLIPEIEKNCVFVDKEDKPLADLFQKNKFVENSIYLHYGWACADIPSGQQYNRIARVKDGIIQPDSIEDIQAKVLTFFSNCRMIMPISSSWRGHHQSCLVKFENRIPSIIYELEEFTCKMPDQFRQKLCLFSSETQDFLLKYNGFG